MKPIYEVVIMVAIVVVLAACIAVFTNELYKENNTHPSEHQSEVCETISIPVSNEDDFSEISYHHLNFQCSDGVICYHVSGEGMWCTRDCDLVRKHCPVYRGECNKCNGVLFP